MEKDFFLNKKALLSYVGKEYKFLSTEGNGNHLIIYLEKRSIKPEHIPSFLIVGLDILKLFITSKNELEQIENFKNTVRLQLPNHGEKDNKVIFENSSGCLVSVWTKTPQIH